jgi:hypothetical protein
MLASKKTGSFLKDSGKSLDRLFISTLLDVGWAVQLILMDFFRFIPYNNISTVYGNILENYKNFYIL